MGGRVGASVCNDRSSRRLGQLRTEAVRGAALVAFVAALTAVGCGTVGRSTSGNVTQGKELYQEHCASCHTLADAGAQSTVGPNLDDAFVRARKDGFDDSTIQDVVRGQIAVAIPPMPTNLVEGEEADAVAAYVASVAGKPGTGAGAQAQGGAGTQATGGKEIFTSAGCANCHVLAAAGAKGTVGPNLDQSKPDYKLALQRISEGRPPMPSYKGQLTDEQIETVARYVVSAAGK